MIVRLAIYLTGIAIGKSIVFWFGGVGQASGAGITPPTKSTSVAQCKAGGILAA